MASYAETETTVTGVQADGYYLIGSNREKHQRRLDAEERATLVNTWGEWKEYRVSADDFDPLAGFKRRLSDAQRQSMSERAKANLPKLQQHRAAGA